MPAIHPSVHAMLVPPSPRTHWCREAIDRAEAEGATWIRGRLVDRLAPDARLRRVELEPALERQFPVQCTLKRRYVGTRNRVVAFKVRRRRRQASH
jgi:hypothetical protein